MMPVPQAERTGRRNPVSVERKTCVQCARTRPASAFRRSPMSRDGLTHACRDCRERRTKANPYIDESVPIGDRSSYDLDRWRETRAVTDEEWALVRRVAARMIRWRRSHRVKDGRRKEDPSCLLDRAGIDQARQTALLSAAYELTAERVGPIRQTRAGEHR